MKRIVCLIIAVMLVMSLFAACASKTQDTPAKVASDDSKATSTLVETTKEELKPVTLRHLTWRVADVNGAYDLFVEKYSSAHPNVTVEIENVPTDQYPSVVKTRIFAGDPPDILGLHPQSPVEYSDLIKNNYLVDITNESFVPNILEGPFERVKVDGKAYGIPYDMNSIGVLYNKQIFEDNGLKIPTTYDELIAVCEALKAKNITPFSYGIKDNYVTQFMFFDIAVTSLYNKYPYEQFDKDVAEGKQILAETPELLKALQMNIDIGKKYGTPNALGIGDQQSVEIFAKGEAAMTATGTWAISVARAANKDLKLGIFAFPANAAGENTWLNSDVGQCIAMASGGKNLDEAKKYLAAWADKDYAQVWASAAKNISTIKGVSNDFDEALVEFGPIAEKCKILPYFMTSTWPAGTMEPFMKNFQMMYADPNKMTPIDVLKSMDKSIADKLKK